MVLPPDEGVRRALVERMRLAVDRAAREADEVVPTAADSARHPVLRRILEDHHVLDTMHVGSGSRRCTSSSALTPSREGGERVASRCGA